jgi:hypothetical protein
VVPGPRPWALSSSSEKSGLTAARSPRIENARDPSLLDSTKDRVEFGVAHVKGVVVAVKAPMFSTMPRRQARGAAPNSRTPSEAQPVAASLLCRDASRPRAHVADLSCLGPNRGQTRWGSNAGGAKRRPAWSSSYRTSLGPRCRTSPKGPAEASGASVDAALPTYELIQPLGNRLVDRRVPHDPGPLAASPLVGLGRGCKRSITSAARPMQRVHRALSGTPWRPAKRKYGRLKGCAGDGFAGGSFCTPMRLLFFVLSCPPSSCRPLAPCHSRGRDLRIQRRVHNTR